MVAYEATSIQSIAYNIASVPLDNYQQLKVHANLKLP